MKKKYDEVSQEEDGVVNLFQAPNVSKDRCLLGFSAIIFSLFVFIIGAYYSGYTFSISSNNAGINNSVYPKSSISLINIADMEAQINDIFRSCDIDGDSRLNIDEFKYFTAVSGAIGEIFEIISFGLPNTNNVLTMEGITNLLKFSCINAGNCDAYGESMQCASAGYTEWNKCIEFIAYGMIATITGNTNEAFITKQQYIDYLSTKLFKQIAKENENYVKFDEYEMFQSTDLKQILQLHPLFENILNNNYEASNIEELRKYSLKNHLESTPNEINEYKMKILKEKERRNLLDSQYSSRSACCDANDCDTWDIDGCWVSSALCVVACITSGGPACFCMLSAGAWCAEVYHCMTKCDCYVYQSAPGAFRESGGNPIMKCDGCSNSFWR